MRRHTFSALLLVLAFTHSVAAQMSSSTARSIRSGTTPPATCKATAPADVFIDLDAASGARFLVCESANTWVAQGGGGLGSGDVVGPASSVDNELALFSGTGGKTLKRATTTGIIKTTSGVIGSAVAGTDYLAPNGNGSGLTALNGSNIASGTVSTARLGSGPADTTTFLRGDNTWAVPPGGGGSPGGSGSELQYRGGASTFSPVSGATSDGTNVTFGSTNLRATSPYFTTGINDANGNPILAFTPTASAVNRVGLTNAAMGSAPSIIPTGSDANIALKLAGKGSGGVEIGGGTTGIFGLLDTDGSHYLNITPGSNLSAERTFTLTTGDANRNLTMTGDATVSGTNTGDQFTSTTASKLLGRGDSGAGAAQEITLGTGLTMTGTTLSASGGGSSQPVTQVVHGGGCTTSQGAPLTTNFYLYDGVSPSIVCSSGGTFGYAQLVLTETSTFAAPFVVPVNWTSGANTLILRGHAGSSISVTVETSTACVAAGENYNSPTFNAAQSATFSITSGQTFAQSYSSLTMAGCVAGEQLLVRIKRTDSNVGNLHVNAVELRTVVP